MSNPTELPDLDFLEAERRLFEADTLETYAAATFGRFPIGGNYNVSWVQDQWAGWQRSVLARRAQPEGEAPQAEPPRMNTDESREYLIKFMEEHFTDKTYHRYIRGERGSVNLAGDFAWQMARALRMLAGAPSAPGTPEAPKPPFPISDEEMAALRRFWECATDGEGYDVEKSMMQRLAEMGLVQRKSGAYYMITEFGLYMLGEYVIQRAAQLDGGQGEGK